MDPFLLAAISGITSLLIGLLAGRATMSNRVISGKIKALEADLADARRDFEDAKLRLRNFKSENDFVELLTAERERGHREGERAALSQFRGSEEFSNLLALEHQKGKLLGATEELEKFHITYTPVLVDVESFISRKVDVGYDMQINYSGFPIGEPTRRITNRQQKSKDENVKLLLDTVNKTLELATEVASKSGIPITIGKSPKRIGK